MAVVAEKVRIWNTGDTFVSNAEGKQNKNFANRRKLFVKENNPDKRWAYLYFGLPFPRNVKVISAKLVLVNGSAIEGATISAQRITEDWKKNKITWNNKPGVAGGIITCQKSGTQPPGTKWEFDITTMLQTVANGAPWYGVRFTANDGKGEWFYGSEAPEANLRPRIVVEYEEKPDAPTNLSPAGGRSVATPLPLLTFDWDDEDGRGAVTAVFVQISSSSDFSTNLWESGWHSTLEPQLLLSETTYSGLPNNSLRYWRVMVRTDSGSESEYSEPEGMKYRPMGVVTINNPSGVSPNAIVRDATPPFLWSFSGTQTAWQVVVYNPDRARKMIWDSGKISGTDTGWTPEMSERIVEDQEYTVEVYVWDDILRENNEDYPPYAVASKTFKVQFSNTVEPVSELSASRVAPYHWTKLQWYRGDAADEYEIYANKQLVEKVPADEIDLAGGYFEYVARLGPPRRDVIWKVVAVVNSVGSSNNPTVTTNYRANSAVLSEVDGSDPLMFLGYDKDEAAVSQETIHDVLGDYPPVLIRQGESKISGSFIGMLTGQAVNDLSVEEEYERWERLSTNPGRTLLLTIIDKSFKCFISEASDQSFADAEGVFHEVSFDYYKVEPK